MTSHAFRQNILWKLEEVAPSMADQPIDRAKALGILTEALERLRAEALVEDRENLAASIGEAVREALKTPVSV